ncbi:PAS domain-containing sensor histidine kinase [Sphingomonas sp. SUN039]|uniref:PAS domain-containing sensor histidine kinase n=1 Tax=Sphingomonas sp. SUN039 TaxID=2937787 RepID=UPI002164B0C7|nr:HWE histidine kinase domain-containing protein [Sphingomonas sp. SUN039]UVO55453.1 PAS domain S-box protein [Sphingomonas sp. SUN039]
MAGVPAAGRIDRAGAAPRLSEPYDWSATSFGSREHWPLQLATMVDFLLASDMPMTLYWGPDWRIVYNQAAIGGFEGRPAQIGMPGAEAWGDWWEAIHSRFAEVARTRHSLTLLDEPFALADGERVREVYWNLTFWPVAGDDGQIAGVLCGARNTTREVFRKKLDRLLVRLDEALLDAPSLQAIMAVALNLIGDDLNADRVGFAEVESANASVAIREVWARDTMPDIRGSYPVGAFGDIGPELARGETVIIDNSAFDTRTADPLILGRHERMHMAAGLVVPIRERDQYRGGIFIQSKVPRVWTPFEIAMAEAATARLWGALQRLRTDFALRASEQRYRLIFEQAEDIIFTADIDQRITDANEAGARAIGLTRDALIGRSIADFVDPQGFAQTTSMLRHKLDHGGNTRHEVAVTSPDGRRMRWENNSTLIVDPDKRPIGLLSISRDVSERRAFEERQALLINELNHRVKNTLALVQAIAHQSFGKSTDSAAAQANFIARIGTLAAAHDLLTREQWEGVTLGELVRAATAPLDATRIDAAGDTLEVTPKAAVALAMALHELGTNAVKYGALSTAEGRVGITWEIRGDRLHLDWREWGGPAVVVPRQRGFGVKMIERALASDLGGRVKVEFAPTGVHCAIDAPRKGNVT